MLVSAVLLDRLVKSSHYTANRQNTSTAVLATTGLSLLNYKSSAEARGTSYC